MNQGTGRNFGIPVVGTLTDSSEGVSYFFVLKGIKIEVGPRLACT